MKTNAFKYIFFAIVFSLIGLAIYMLYKDGKSKAYVIENGKVEINMVKEINVGISNFDTINPILSKNRDVQYITKLVFEPLVDITYDFKIENKLSKEFSKINNTTYIIKLNDDVYFHDGKKFTADDVIFTINTLKSGDIDSIYKENVSEIKEIQKIDDYTIKIILNKEVEFFEYLMCIPILSENENIFKADSYIPIGTGKFKITKTEDNNITLERANVDASSKTTKINLILKENVKDLYTALTKKEIDLMITNNIHYEEYIGSIGYNTFQYSGREFDYLILNNKNSILSSNQVRKAIYYSIDKNQINYNIYNNKYNICDFPLNDSNYLHCIEDKNEYDINKAKNALIEDGWTFSNNTWRKNGRTLRLRLLVNKENEARIKVAENIKEQLNKVGIILNIIKVNENQFNNYIKNKNYDIILSGQVISNSPKLNTYFSIDNLSNYSSPEINTILNEVKNIENQEDVLKEKYIKIEELYKQDMPFISLYFNSIYVLSNKNLKGDLNGNWYNVYYNIDNWYKVKDN